MDLFTQDEIKRLLAILDPRRKRFPFSVSMERWAAFVLNVEPEFGWVGPPEFAWCGSDDPVASMVRPPPRPIVVRRKRLGRRNSEIQRRRGRRPDDTHYYAALLLAVIYHEYTVKAPTRVWDPVGGREASPFFQFAAAAFSILRRPTPERALREVCKRWARSRDFNKTAMRKLLFDAPARRPDAVQQRAEKVAARLKTENAETVRAQNVTEMAAYKTARPEAFETHAALWRKELALRTEILRRRDAADDCTELLRSLRTIHIQRMVALRTLKGAGD